MQGKESNNTMEESDFEVFLPLLSNSSFSSTRSHRVLHLCEVGNLRKDSPGKAKKNKNVAKGKSLYLSCLKRF